MSVYTERRDTTYPAVIEVTVFQCRDGKWKARAEADGRSVTTCFAFESPWLAAFGGVLDLLPEQASEYLNKMNDGTNQEGNGA